jgi:hypothetical protein
MEATTLAEFDLLQNSRKDIQQQPWVQPSYREAMNLYFGIKRAKEETLRLNIEICHLVTFMVDDHQDFYHAIAANIIVDPHLTRELSSQWEFHQQIHLQIARRLHQTSCLKGFTGTLSHSTREGHELTHNAFVMPPWLEGIFGLVKTYNEVDGDEDMPKEVVANSDLVVQLLENITFQDDLDTSSNKF